MYVPVDKDNATHCALILRAHGDPAAVVRGIAPAAATINETVQIALMRASRESLLEVLRRMITLIGSLGWWRRSWRRRGCSRWWPSR